MNVNIWNIYLNCGWKINRRKILAVTTQLKQLRKESLKKIQAWTGFELMTSAMPVQCSINWAIKPTGSWSYCEFVIYPSADKPNISFYSPTDAAQQFL